MRRSSEGSGAGDLIVDLDSDQDCRRTSPAPLPPPPLPPPLPPVPPSPHHNTAPQDEEEVEVDEGENIVCAPSIPSLLLSTSSTCSSPSPPPPSVSPTLSSSSQSNMKRPVSGSAEPPSKRSRTESGSNSPSPKSQQSSPKSPRRGTPNGVITVNNSNGRNNSLESANSQRKALAAVLSHHLSQVDSTNKLSNLLLAAVAASSVHREDTGGNGAPLLKSPPVLPFSGKGCSKNPTLTKPSHITPIIPTPLLLPTSRTSSADLLSKANILPLLTSEMALRMATEAAAVVAPPPPPPPQVLVKQGVSKCRECNIVFCKHENYMAHKKHYCSARLEVGGDDGGNMPSPQGGVPNSPSGNTPNGGSPPHSKDHGRSASPTIGSSLSVQQQQGQAGQKPPTLVQFICVACGIKFTSLDNLTAHQAYYCPKRSELIAKTAAEAVSDKNSILNPRKCVKCKVSSQHCS